MTRSEAVQAMQQGKKVTHRHFTTNEWMTMRGSFTIIFEDGVECNALDFWSDRTGDDWFNGFSIWQGGE